MIPYHAKRGAFHVNLYDEFIGKSIRVYGEWAESELELLEKYVKRGDVVIDIGANIGTHTVAFAKMVGKDGLVIAFEPQARIFQLLCANVVANDLGNVQTFCAALGAKSGVGYMPNFDFEHTNNLGGARLTYDPDPKKLPVDIWPLDRASPRRVNLIKMDAEGAECEILMGAVQTITKHKPIIYAEANSERANTMAKMIMGLGYRVFIHRAEAYRENNFNGASDENTRSRYVETNVICFPKETQQNLPALEEYTEVQTG